MPHQDEILFPGGRFHGEPGLTFRYRKFDGGTGPLPNQARLACGEKAGKKAASVPALVVTFGASKSSARAAGYGANPALRGGGADRCLLSASADSILLAGRLPIADGRAEYFKRLLV